MSKQNYSLSVLVRILSLAYLAAGCDSGGTSLGIETGGTRTAGGNSSMPGGGTSSAGGGSGNTPTGGAGPATGGAGTGGNATGGAPCVPGTQIGASFSTNYFIMAFSQLSPFYVFNNGWSSTATNLTSSGASESVAAFETCTPGTISWSTTYSWNGDTSSVKAYPAAILGWHSTKGFKVDSSLTGLPKAISSLTSVKCSWDFVPSSGAQDISFDIWVHSTACNTTAIGASTAPSDEIMIWLYSNGGVNPIGYNGSGTQVSAAGANWSLYNGTVSSWAVHSFVRQGTTTSVQDLDILALLKTSSLGLSSKCLTSIEAGIEVFNGSGTMKTNSYKCTVQ